jgi:hypothetical protein
MDLSRRKIARVLYKLRMDSIFLNTVMKTFVEFRRFYFLIQNDMNNVMLLLRKQMQYLYIWTSVVENCSGLITITKRFHKFIHCYANIRCSSLSEER